MLCYNVILNTKSLNEEVQKIKSNEDWRRDFMTMNMLMKEKVNLGAVKKTVSLIRDVKSSDIELASQFLKVDVSYIHKVLSLINDTYKF